MFEAIVHWYYGLPPYAWWLLNIAFFLLGVFVVGLLTFGMAVNNGEMSENPKNVREFIVGIFALGFFVSAILAGVWFLAFRK